MPEILPAPVTDLVLDQVASRLRELQRSAALAFAIEVGSLIVDSLFGGDLAAWRLRGATDASFRRLAAREDLGGLGKSALHRSVQVYALLERLGRPEWKHLGLAHVRAVLPLTEQEQRSLLQSAEVGRWTSRRLETEVAARKGPSDGRGRPPLPTFVKSIHALARIVDREGADPFGDLDAVDTLTEDDARDLLEQVGAVRRRCEEVERRLAPKVAGGSS